MEPRKHPRNRGPRRVGLIPTTSKERRCLAAQVEYQLPEELARKERVAPDELRAACRKACQGLGWREKLAAARERT